MLSPAPRYKLFAQGVVGWKMGSGDPLMTWQWARKLISLLAPIDSVRLLGSGSRVTPKDDFRLGSMLHSAAFLYTNSYHFYVVPELVNVESSFHKISLYFPVLEGRFCETVANTGACWCTVSGLESWSEMIHEVEIAFLIHSAHFSSSFDSSCFKPKGGYVQNKGMRFSRAYKILLRCLLHDWISRMVKVKAKGRPN